jgi:hypothetical protein
LKAYDGSVFINPEPAALAGLRIGDGSGLLPHQHVVAIWQGMPMGLYLQADFHFILRDSNRVAHNLNAFRLGDDSDEEGLLPLKWRAGAIHERM